MKPNNIEEVATKVYNYMQEHKIIGRENGYNRLTLAFLLGIGERRFREALSYINEHDEKFDKAVSTSHCIYLCETDEEEGWAYGASWKQILGLIRKANGIKRRRQNRNQCKIVLSAEEYDAMLDTFERGVK